MSTVTDAEVEAACEAFVGQWDEVLLFVDWFSLRADMRSALEAAEAVRVKPITWVERVAALRASLGREPTLVELLDETKNHTLTPEEHEAQRQSWMRAMQPTGDLSFD